MPVVPVRLETFQAAKGSRGSEGLAMGAGTPRPAAEDDRLGISNAQVSGWVRSRTGHAFWFGPVLVH